MESSKKRVILLASIAIFALIVIVGGATFAYFRSNTNVVNGIFNVGVGTANSASFSAYSEGNIEFNVNASQMAQVNISQEYIATDNANGTARIEAGNSASTTTCTYDLVWVWDSEDRYMMSDVELPYTSADGKVYPYEFSVKVDDEVEKDLSSLDWNEEGKAVISHKTLISQSGVAVEDNFNIQVNMYNIPIDQIKLFNKSFHAHITVENNKCIVTKSDVALKYYVKNLLAEEYTQVDNAPKGNYKLVTNETVCENGGSINNYDRLTGSLDITTTDKDVCNVYFQELNTIQASGTDVIGTYGGSNNHINVNIEGLTDYQVYYSTEKELNEKNYSEGSATNPIITDKGETTVYWCAVAENYIPYCSDNKVTIGDELVSVTGSDITKTYDGNSYGITVNVTNPSNATVYYSEGTEINQDNYKTTEGVTMTNPTRSSAGSTIVYWCAEAEGYTTLCGNNKITINNATMSASGSNYSGSSSGKITVKVTKPTSGYQVYYSTTTKLTSSNYTSGNTTNPSSSNDATVYWCAVADNYTPYCSSNKISIVKKFASYITSLVGKTQGDGKIINENGIRYEGNDPDNYVRFNDELWRIIGVFDNKTHGRSGEQLVKIVRDTKLPKYYQYNPGVSNNWNNSNIKSMLNNNYYNNDDISACSKNTGGCTKVTVTGEGIKSNTARNMIQQIYWKIGVGSRDVVSKAYTAERGDTKPKSDGATVVSKEELPIGLIYPSDYGYAVLASDCARTIKLSSYGDTSACKNNNWLLYSTSEIYWTLSPDSTSLAVYYIENGKITDYNATQWAYSVVPVLYLKSTVKVTGGSGTSYNPYTLSL